MKWIGQSLVDFIARFRSDVYLEDISSGTIASGGNLGLDSNNKVVKDSGVGATDLHGAGVDGSNNQLLTDDGDGTVTSEANLTFDGTTLAVAGLQTITSTTADQFKVLYDASNYALMNVSSSGDLEVETIGAGTTDSDITLNADGGIILNADSGQITFKDDSTFIGSIEVTGAGPILKLYDDGDVNSQMTLRCDASAATYLTTSDSSGANAHFEVEANGNITLDADGDIALECGGGNLTCDADTVTFESANADDPAVIIKNTTNDNQAARLQFKKDRGAAAVDNDRVAEIDFIGEDAEQNSQQYGKIMVQAQETDHGNEAGTIKFQVAQYDGSIGLNGLTITGSKTTDDVIDVDVGYGADSTTTIAGDLTVTGALTIDEHTSGTVGMLTVQDSGTSFADSDTSFMTASAIENRIVASVADGVSAGVGQYAVLRATNFYIFDNPMIQNSLYFGNSAGNNPGNWNDPKAAGGPITSTSSFTIDEDDMNWGIILPFNISKIEVQCSLRTHALGGGDDFTIAIYTGIRSNGSNTALTLTKVADNEDGSSGVAGIVFDANKYVTNDLDYTADLAKDTMIYVGIGSEDATDAKNLRGYMNITVVRR